MQFFATGHVTDPAQLAAHQEEETRATEQLRADGVILAAFRRLDGGGIVSFVQGESLSDVEKRMSELPFVQLGLLHFDYVEIVDL